MSSIILLFQNRPQLFPNFLYFLNATFHTLSTALCTGMKIPWYFSWQKSQHFSLFPQFFLLFPDIPLLFPNFLYIENTTFQLMITALCTGTHTIWKYSLVLFWQKAQHFSLFPNFPYSFPTALYFCLIFSTLKISLFILCLQHCVLEDIPYENTLVFFLTKGTALSIWPLPFMILGQVANSRTNLYSFTFNKQFSSSTTKALKGHSMMDEQ